MLLSEDWTWLPAETNQINFMMVNVFLQHWRLPVLHWLAGGGVSVRGTALAAARMGRTKNKNVKTVATRANIVTEDCWCFGSAGRAP